MHAFVLGESVKNERIRSHRHERVKQLIKLLLLKNYTAEWKRTPKDGQVLYISERSGSVAPPTPESVEDDHSSTAWPTIPEPAEKLYSIQALFSCGIPLGEPPVKILNVLRKANKRQFQATSADDGRISAPERLACSDTELLVKELRTAITAASGGNAKALRFNSNIDTKTNMVSVNVGNISSKTNLAHVINILCGKNGSATWLTDGDKLELNPFMTVRANSLVFD